MFVLLILVAIAVVVALGWVLFGESGPAWVPRRRVVVERPVRRVPMMRRRRITEDPMTGRRVIEEELPPGEY